MNAFISALAAEWSARRRRLREALGDRSQSLIDFLVMGGLLVGSVGLFSRPWMPGAAPWGFALPAVFAVGFLLIEARRQRALKAGADPEKLQAPYDWAVILWSLACALAGLAAFVLAWAAAPPPPPEPPPPEWLPPQSTIDSTFETPPQ